MRKILIPVDGSQASKKAVEKGLEMAEMFRSEITLIHVVNLPDPLSNTRYDIYLESYYQKMTDNLMKAGIKFLDSFAEEMKLDEVVYKKLVVSGQPYEEILKTASEGEFDLIVMGRRGYSKIKRFFVGSVTQRVISDSHCPVLVVEE